MASNTLLTPTAVTRESLRVLHQKLNFIGRCNLQYDDQFAKTGAKIGESLKVRMPNKYVVRTGKTFTTGGQDTLNRSVTLSGPTTGTSFDQIGVDLQFTSNELTMSMDDFSKRIIDPSMSVLAATIESNVMTYLYKRVSQSVGTAGSPVNSLNTVLQARKKLNDALAPMDNSRTVTMSTQHNLDLVDSLKGLFQSSSQIAEQYREGAMGKTSGFDFYENTLVPRHTAGLQGGTPTTNGAQGQNGGAWAESASLVTQAWSNSITGVVKEGDIITIADCYSVHPETRVSTGQLKQFVVRADATSSGAGAATLTISPAPIYAGPYQNINAQIQTAKAITVVGTTGQNYGQSLAFHKDAFAFVTADLILPDGVDWKARETYDGISMRMVRAYDINNDAFPCRLDVLFACGVLYEELACRIVGN